MLAVLFIFIKFDSLAELLFEILTILVNGWLIPYLRHIMINSKKLSKPYSL